MTETLDIRAKAPYPAGALSNFAPRAFVFDGVPCASLEGLLQSLKIADEAKQRRVCGFTGPAALGIGRKYKWRGSGTLWWKGAPITRLSDAYQAFLDRAFQTVFDQCEAYRDALAATGGATLTHEIGKDDPCETILTREEFCGRLDRLRSGVRLA